MFLCPFYEIGTIDENNFSILVVENIQKKEIAVHTNWHFFPIVWIASLELMIHYLFLVVDENSIVFFHNHNRLDIVISEECLQIHQNFFFVENILVIAFVDEPKQISLLVLAAWRTQ